MFKKLSLFCAAAAMALAMQTAMAQDDAPDFDDEPDYPADYDGDMGPGFHRWGGPGPRGGMRHHRDWDGPGRPVPRHMGPGPKHMGGHFGKGILGPRFMDVIQLDDAQKTKIVDIMTENYREGLLARMEMHDAARTLRDSWDADAPNHDAIVQANQELGAARGKMDVLKMKMHDDIMAVLTPDQKAKVEEMWNNPPPRPDRDGKKWDGKRDGKRHPGPGPRR